MSNWWWRFFNFCGLLIKHELYSSRISIGLLLLIRNNWSSLFTKSKSNRYLFSWKLNALKCNSDHKIKSIFVFKIETIYFWSRILSSIFYQIFFLCISLSRIATRCLEKISWKHLWFHKEFDQIMFYFFPGASSTPKKSPYHRHLPSQATRV